MARHSLRERSFRSVPANASRSPRRTSSRFPLFRARTLPAQTQRRTVSADRPVSRAASLISNSSSAIPAMTTFYYIRRGVVEVVIKAQKSYGRQQGGAVALQLGGTDAGDRAEVRDRRRSGPRDLGQGLV